MAIAVEMPKMSDTMEEGVLVAWMVEEGETVSAGDVIAQVETDKATMDLEAYDDGVLLKRVVEEGEAVPIGALIAVLGQEGEDISDLLAKQGGGGTGQAPEEKEAPADAADEAPEATADEADAAAAPSGDGTPTSVPDYGTPGPSTPTTTAASAGGDGAGRLKASPLARKLAGDHGVDLAAIQGSGPEGRIIKRDIEAVLDQGGAVAAPAQVETAPTAAPDRPAAPAPTKAPAAAPAADGEYTSVRISQMRKTIARRLAESKYTAPHFYLTADIDMARAVAFRTQLNELAAQQERGKVSFNDLITKACALALRQHPMVNGSYLADEGEIRQHADVHIGVAVAIDEGLVTPVIRHADRKGLAEIAAETRALAERARDRTLGLDEMAGSTFTTSNLGMFGIDEFTAIINPPNACILAIGAIRDVPVVEDGEVVPGKRMKITLSCDHRIVDGATGAQFLQTVRHYLEDPLNMLL